MRKLNILFTPGILRWKISTRWSTVVILLSVAPCMLAHTVANWNLFHSDVIVVSALLAVTNMPWNALPVCPLSWLMFLIAIVFLPSTRISVTFFLKIALYWIVSSILSIPLSLVCFLRWINPKTSLLASSWSCILSDVIWNGTRIFIVWF